MVDIKPIIPYVFLKASQAFLVSGAERGYWETNIGAEAKREGNIVFGLINGTI